MKALQTLILIPLGLAALTPLRAATDAAPSAQDNTALDPQVVAFYARQCASYADAAALAGEARDAYLADCQHNAPQIWPVGPDDKDD